MDFNLVTGSLNTLRTGCLIIGVFEKSKLSPSGSEIDRATEKYLSRFLKKGDFSGTIGETYVLHNLPNILAERVMLVGCGAVKDLNPANYLKIIDQSAKTLLTIATANAISCLTELEIKDCDLQWKTNVATRSIVTSAYRSDTLKTQPVERRAKLKKFSWLASDKPAGHRMKKGINFGVAIGEGINLSRELGDLPGNICTPTYLAEQAKSISSQLKKLKTKILEEQDMERLGMGALLSVSRGSRQPAKLIIMEYSGAQKDKKPIVFVGKGLTFDSGGISIKPSPSMDEMKYDMCGGASVFGAIKAIATLGLPINVIGVIPSSENMPDGDANKPGDIVTSLSGQTIEVLNTDAEGRLILCDALTYCEKFSPDVIIDIATLTGACVIALGHHASGLFSNHDKLAHDLEKAGNTSLDRTWRMPLWDDYQEQLKSNFADMANIGGREGGSITAACFLSRYTKDYRWAHLDIAGSAWLSGNKKGSTGRPVSLLVQYVIDRCGKSIK